MTGRALSSSFPGGLENLESRRLLSVSASLVPVSISSAAIKADPTLANCKTYDLQVTLDSGERWIATDMDAELTTGGFYNVSSAGHGADFLQPNLWPLLPALQFDTGVSQSGFQKPFILGQFKPLTQTPTFSSTSTNVSWGALSDTGTGTFTVARLTMSANASGTITGDLGSTLTDANHLKPFSFTIKGGTVSVGGDTGGGNTGGGSPSLSFISGNVFNDTNGNGKADDHAGVSGIKVYLDKNKNGRFDHGEKYRYTDASGNYKFDSLTAGTYYVREVVPTGYRRTTSTTRYTVTLKSGVNGTGKNFGLTNTALLSGTVFSDKNSNGKKDSGESGVAGFRIWIDTNNNGKLDSGERYADSDSNGYWVFKNLKHGKCIVRIQSRSGYKTIGNSSMSMSLASGGTYTGRLFAEHKA